MAEFIPYMTVDFYVCIDPSMFFINVHVFPNMVNDAANNNNIRLDIRWHC